MGEEHVQLRAGPYGDVPETPGTDYIPVFTADPVCVGIYNGSIFWNDDRVSVAIDLFPTHHLVQRSSGASSSLDPADGMDYYRVSDDALVLCIWHDLAVDFRQKNNVRTYILC